MTEEEFSQETKDRVEGAKLAAEIVQLSGIDECSEATKQGFYRGLRRLCGTYCTEPKPGPGRPVMSDEEAARFERRFVGFGKFADRTWRDVPNSYLSWLHEQEVQLGAYLRSERGQRRQLEGTD